MPGKTVRGNWESVHRPYPGFPFPLAQGCPGNYEMFEKEV